jgi:hypothetical protein
LIRKLLLDSFFGIRREDGARCFVGMFRKVACGLVNVPKLFLVALAPAQIKKCSRFLIRMLSGIGSSIDRDKMRTILRHLGVYLPISFTSMVCHQLLRARTDGLPIGDGLYGSSGIRLFLRLAYRTNSSQDIRAGPCAPGAASPRDCDR